MLREVTVKVGLERIDTQEGITVEALLDSCNDLKLELRLQLWQRLEKG